MRIRWSCSARLAESHDLKVSPAVRPLAWMTSVMPPRSGTMTGVPWLIASAATMPKGSRWMEG